MHFNFPLISSFLLASAALADRGGELNQSRFAERDRIDTNYWTGSVLEGSTIASKSDTSFDVVGATFIVPDVWPAGDSDVYGVSIWVGIGGGSLDEVGSDGPFSSSPCEWNNTIQAGVSLNVTRKGTVSCTPWFAWYPTLLGGTPEISISPGHEVRIAVGVTADQSNGTFYINNLDMEEQWTYMSIKAPHHPCMNYAEWVVEDYMVNDTVIPFANFTPITFTNAAAFDTNNDIYGPEVGTIAHMDNRAAWVAWKDKNTMTIERSSDLFFPHKSA